MSLETKKRSILGCLLGKKVTILLRKAIARQCHNMTFDII